MKTDDMLHNLTDVNGWNVLALLVFAIFPLIAALIHGARIIRRDRKSRRSR